MYPDCEMHGMPRGGGTTVLRLKYNIIIVSSRSIAINFGISLLFFPVLVTISPLVIVPNYIILYTNIYIKLMKADSFFSENM